jgi:NhaP-type Na+/H+ or K+/H+ antiporter
VIVYAVVVFSIVVQGLTMPWLLRRVVATAPAN